jgi:hypothetical protein
VLLRVEPLVGHAQGLARVRRFVRDEHGPEGARDLEPFAAFGQRAAGAVDERLGVADADRCHEAELVPAEPVRRPTVAGNLRELRPQTGEQRIAGGVPEAVVIALDPVEVEHH